MYQAKGRDCVFYILRNWKIIVVVALIGAVLMGGLDVFKTVRRWDRDKKQCEIDAIEYSDAYKIASDAASIYDAQIEANNLEIERLSGNPILDFDTEKIGTSSVFLRFDTVTYEDGSSSTMPAGIMNLYSNAINDLTDWDKVGKKGKIDGDYAKQLFFFSVDATNNIIYVRMFGETQSASDGMLKEILKELKDYKSTMESDVSSKFTVSEMNKTGKTGPDEEFANLRNGIVNKINDLNNDNVNINNVKAEIEFPVEPPTMPTKIQVAKSIVKYVVFGAGVGGCGMVALFYVLFYLNNKLHSADELEFYTGAVTMAYDFDKKNKIDRMIAKRENRGLLYSQEDAVVRTVDNIKLSCPDVSKVMFTGIDSEVQIKSIKSSLEKTKDLGIQYGLEKNILTDKVAFDHLKNYDAVVLVEKIDKISTSLIKKEVEQIEIAGKKVIGTLLIR